MKRRKTIAVAVFTAAALCVVGGTAAVAMALEPQSSTRVLDGGPLTDGGLDDDASTPAPSPTTTPAPPAGSATDGSSGGQTDPHTGGAPVEQVPPPAPQPVQPAPQPVQGDDDDDDGDDDDGGDDDGDD